MKPKLFTSFARHYWPLLIVFVVLVVIGRIDAITYFVGPIFYLLEMVVGCMVAAAFAKHIFYRYTVDSYTDEDEGDEQISGFVRDWNNLANPELKVVLTFVTLWVLYLGAAWIAANVVK